MHRASTVRSYSSFSYSLLDISVIVMLAAAELLGRPSNYAVRNLTRNIMFTLFHGVRIGLVLMNVYIYMCVCMCV